MMPNSCYTTDCARRRAQVTLLTPLFPYFYGTRHLNFYQELSLKMFRKGRPPALKRPGYCEASLRNEKTELTFNPKSGNSSRR